MFKHPGFESCFRFVIWSSVIALALAIAVSGCAPAPQAQGQLPLPTGNGPANTWNFQPMTSGPGVFWSCVNGDRIYAMNRQAWRSAAGLWPDASLTVVPGGCRGLLAS